MSNILKEALADSKALKAAALRNAQNLILENMKHDLKEMVEDSMNETADGDADDVGTEDEESGEDTMSEELDFGGEEEDGLDGLDLGEEGDEDEDADDLGGRDDEDGLSESDLHEALASALSEVSHGGLSEPEVITPDKHPTGLMDQDKKEQGWDEKAPPAKQSFTVKESIYRKKIANLVAENTLLRKANSQLKRTVNEVNLFNTKLHFAHKLLNKEGLSHNTKRAIISKFDGVKSVNEAKTLYESLELAFGSLSENSNKKSGKKTSLSEALGVRPQQGPNVSPKASPEVLVETAMDPYDPRRLQMLAGITKK